MKFSRIHTLIILLSIAMSIVAKGKPVSVWVFFDGKNPGRSIEASARSSLSERALARRSRDGIALDIRDVPVDRTYIDRITAMGAHLRRKSRWLDGASFDMSPSTLEAVAKLPFVREVRPIGRYRRPIEPIERERPSEGSEDSLYGSTRAQLEMLGAVDLHEMGYAGEGVLVGMLDSGFRLTHRAFDSLNVVAKFDFIHNDTTVDYDTLAGDTDFYGFRHGTQTLGCIAGYSPGEYIGAAYRASVALAKTEFVDSEYVTEEDNWVAGIEWLDSVGVDIVSSSLGYSVFDADTPYSFDDLDGNTCITTIAADIAASRGICVVNSAGNERTDQIWPHIIAPADGDSVLAVAAVGIDHVIAPFSSPGPTADGRIKPDCAAVGYGTIVLNPYLDQGVMSGSGTSFSCPLIAGLCAAVMSANPELFGYDLALAVRSSGDRYRAFDPSYPADSADNDYGWGIPKATVAAGFHIGLYGRAIDNLTGNTISNKEIRFIYSGETRVDSTDTFGIFVDPFADAGDSVMLYIPGWAISERFAVDGSGRAVRFDRLGAGRELQIFPNPASSILRAIAYSGQNARFSVFNSAGELLFDHSWPLSESVQYIWPLVNNDGRAVANGIYIVRLATEQDEILRKIAVVR